MARAFANAGVEHLVASLWKVEDESTKVLMTKFYEEIVKGVEYREALRTAKLHLLTFENGRFSNPRYWAAFILMGKA